MHIYVRTIYYIILVYYIFNFSTKWGHRWILDSSSMFTIQYCFILRLHWIWLLERDKIKKIRTYKFSFSILFYLNILYKNTSIYFNPKFIWYVYTHTKPFSYSLFNIYIYIYIFPPSSSFLFLIFRTQCIPKCLIQMLKMR